MTTANRPVSRGEEGPASPGAAARKTAVPRTHLGPPKKRRTLVERLERLEQFLRRDRRHRAADDVREAIQTLATSAQQRPPIPRTEGER